MQRAKDGFHPGYLDTHSAHFFFAKPSLIGLADLESVGIRGHMGHLVDGVEAV